MPAVNLMNPSIISKTLCSAVQKKQMAILFWAATPSHGNAGPQALCSHGKAKTTSFPWRFSRQRSFTRHVPCPPAPIHVWDSRSWQPHDSLSHGEGCGRPVGCLRWPRPYHCGCQDPTVAAATTLPLRPPQPYRCSCHGPTIAAATTQRSKKSLPLTTGKGDEWSVNVAPKVAPLPALTFIPIKTLAMGVQIS